MKKYVKKIIITLTIICFLFAGIIGFLYYVSHPKIMHKRKPFETQYTIEEHIERISLETEKRFTEFINSDDFHSYSVEILYSFAGYPEFFMVEFAYHRNIKNDPIVIHPLNYNYVIGFIEDDEYYIGIDYIDRERTAKFEFIDIKTMETGENPYRRNNALERKKYFGADSTCGYEENGEIILAYTDNSNYADFVVGNAINNSYFEYLNNVRIYFPTQYYKD